MKQKQAIPTKNPAKMIEGYNWKRLGAEPWATSLSIGPWCKETVKKAREHLRQKKNKKIKKTKRKIIKKGAFRGLKKTCLKNVTRKLPFQ